MPVTNFPESPDIESATHWFYSSLLPQSHKHAQQMLDVEIRFDLTGIKAGLAHLDKQLIRINPQLFDFPDNCFYALSDTIIHELAHIMCYALYGRVKPHGKEWKKCALLLGGSCEVRHSLALTKARKTRAFSYHMPDGSIIQLSSLRHKRLQYGKVKYHVRATGKRIQAHYYNGHNELT